MNKIKNNSYNQFKKLGYPSKKLESWKFSNSSHLKKYDTVISNSNIDIKEHLEKKNTLCFVNGVFIKESLENCTFKNEISISNTVDITEKDIIEMSENSKKKDYLILGLQNLMREYWLNLKKGIILVYKLIL